MVDSVTVWFTGSAHIELPAGRWLKSPDADEVRLKHDGLGNFKAEAELPKLLWGHNGRLLTNQDELDQSVEQFRSHLLSKVEFSSWEFKRVDLCWHFRTRATDVILAHQWLRFPGVRSLPSLLYGGKQISWRGGKLGLKFYDKAKAIGDSGSVLRVELRLAGAQLRKRIDANAPLKFDELYNVFRAEVLKLSPLELPEARKHSFAEIFANLQPEVRSQALLDYRQGRTSRAVREFDRRVSGACLRRIEWNWRDILPADNPPPPVNVEPRNRRQNET